jgi:hypothetical protein
MNESEPDRTFGRQDVHPVRHANYSPVKTRTTNLGVIGLLIKDGAYRLVVRQYDRARWGIVWHTI